MWGNQVTKKGGKDGGSCRAGGSDRVGQDVILLHPLIEIWRINKAVLLCEKKSFYYEKQKWQCFKNTDIYDIIKPVLM